MEECEPPSISHIVEKYPELQKYEGQELAWTISAINSNNRTVDHFIEGARNGTSTGSVEYLLGFVQSMLDELPADPALAKFAEDEAALHEKNSAKAAEVVGDKVRESDGVYRSPRADGNNWSDSLGDRTGRGPKG